MKIAFFLQGIALNLSKRILLKKFISGIFEQEQKVAESVGFIFCEDEYLLSINRRFLKHDEYTDIITFSLSEPTRPIIGEIYISVERIRENASEIGVDFNRELHRVMFHGILHLCGYKDKTMSDKRKMTIFEDKYLSKYFD